MSLPYQMEKWIVVSINISEQKGKKKIPINDVIITSAGLENDAHSGNWHRQVSLLAEESIDKMRGKGLELSPGDFAENITTRGILLGDLSIGQQFCLGETELEVTQIGKECHLGCEIRNKVGDCIMPKEGIFARVLKPGKVVVGDRIGLI